MGQGQDKVARNLVDLQPTAIVELFLIYFDTIDNENAYIAFHGGSSFANGIVWQGVEYLPLPVETEGFEITANGELPRPKIKISNKDYFITDLLNRYQDLQFAKIVRKRTFVKFLDDVNFDGGNPWGEADSSAEISNDTYLIGQKTAENKLFVELELTSPLDLENFEVNHRVILARYCSWYYRGAGCNYDGPPLETEDNEKIFLNDATAINWATIKINNQWKVGSNYLLGDAVFLYNTKSSNEVSKIWYVCKENHVSVNALRPDLSLKYWVKDGCGKKLANCQKRFVNNNFMYTSSFQGTLTNNYFNLKYIDINSYNTNIATLATVTQNTYLSNQAVNIGANVIDKNINTAWIANDNKGTVTLTWPSAQTINQINIYDGLTPANNIKNAVVDLYNGTTTPFERVSINAIPDNGNKNHVFTSNKTVTSIRISGSGVAGKTSLAQVEVLKPSGVGLLFDNSVDKIHSSPCLHISTWIQFPNGLINSSDNFNIFHNVEKDCPYSGLNLFARNKDLVLQFAVAQTLKIGTNYTDTFVNKELVVPDWPFTTLVPLHIEIFKGKASGVNPSKSFIDEEGYIKIYSTDDIGAEYILQTQRDVVNANGDILDVEEPNKKPSYFKFKNIDLQGGINNNLLWCNNNYNVNSENVTSNIVLGPIAIWTGSDSVSREQNNYFFNRDDNYNQINNPSLVKKNPIKFSETNINMQENLFVWWDMDLSNSAPYSILSSNLPQKTLTLTGQYNALMDNSTSTTYNQVKTITQTPQESLPFGGFPGTDRYGR